MVLDSTALSMTKGGSALVDVPFPGAIGTELDGINDRGQIVGLLTTSGGQEHGFLDDRGLFSPIVAPFPGTEPTLTFGINNEGQIVGGYVNISGSHGFVDHKGRFSSIDVPFAGALETSAFGINDRNQNDRADDRGNRGQIVGQYHDNVGPHGFVDNKGRFSPIDVPFPGASATFARDINDRGQIVGIYDDSTGRHGFVDDRGRFSPIDVPFPGVSETNALGINNRGRIVGLYFDSSGGHGFLADPVERFAGTPGKANCPGQSVSAVARQFGGLNAAAAALEFSNAQALEDAILAFCQE